MPPATTSFTCPRRRRYDDPVGDGPMTVLDPITLALTQNRLDHISLQMGWVMTRTARSPIFSQAQDFSCFIANADGVLVYQAEGVPIHDGGGGIGGRGRVAALGGDIGDGGSGEGGGGEGGGRRG